MLESMVYFCGRMNDHLILITNQLSVELSPKYFNYLLKTNKNQFKRIKISD